MDYSSIGVEMKSNIFRSEWGQGRKLVTADTYHSAKRAMEDLVKDPSIRGDEPPCDSFKTHLGKDFKYSFGTLMSKKRSRGSSSNDDVITIGVRRYVLRSIVDSKYHVDIILFNNNNNFDIFPYKPLISFIIGHSVDVLHLCQALL